MALMIDAIRREELRLIVRGEKARADHLGRRVTDAQLKHLVMLASTRIGEVESFFLDQLDDRSPSQESFWLDNAEAILEMRLTELIRLEVAAAKPSADVTTI
jgi:hypothetical protein